MPKIGKKTLTTVFVAMLVISTSLQALPAEEVAVGKLTSDIPYEQNPVYLGLRIPMRPDSPLGVWSGDARYTISPELPDGIFLNSSTGIITGKPTHLAPLKNYLITREQTGVVSRSNLALGVFSRVPGVLHPTQGYVGNSFSGDQKSAHSGKEFVPNDIDALYVSPDGKLYTDSDYDEGGNTASVFYQHHFVMALQDIHGWQRIGGQAITTDGRFIFVAIDQHGGIAQEGYPSLPCGTFYAVRRYTMDGAPAPFTHRGDLTYRNENGWDGSFLTISEDVQSPERLTNDTSKCSALVSAGGVLSQMGARVTGLAVFKGRLYVSDYIHHKIRVFNTVTMHEYRNVALTLPQNGDHSPEYPWQLAVDVRHHVLWSVERYSGEHAKGRIVSYTIENNGKLRSAVGAISQIQDPSAIAVDPTGRYLLITDDAPSSQQVFIYTLNLRGIPRKLRTIGIAGGPFNNHLHRGGEASSQIFNHPVGVGMDQAGKLYIASNGHGIDRQPIGEAGGGNLHHGSLFTSISEFSFHPHQGILDPYPLETFKYFDGLFVDNLAFIDNRAYSKYFDFSFNVSRNKNIKLQIQLKNYTLDPYHYPDDARLTNERAGIWARKVDGNTLLFMSSQIPINGLAVYRFKAGVAVPAAYLYLSPETHSWPDGFPRSGTWIWTDRNRNGKVDGNEISERQLPALHSLVWAWSSDEQGNVWAVPEYPDPITQHFSIYTFPLNTIDQTGIPHYADVASLRADTSLENNDFSRIERFQYDAHSDVAFIAGYGLNDEMYRDDWGVLGTKLARYDHWSNPQRRIMRWSVNLPFALSLKRQFDRNISTTSPKVLSFAGRYLFVAFTAPRMIQVIDAQTGQVIGQPILPSDKLGTADSILDLTYGSSAILISGNYILLSLEEDNRGKNIYYIFNVKDLM